MASVARRALEVMEDLRAAEDRVSALTTELETLVGRPRDEFEKQMRLLLNGGIEVSLVRLGSDGSVVERQEIDMNSPPSASGGKG
jgi:sugar/nucleoside kinase (ribokinase family)